jgi:hypothetical protein
MSEPDAATITFHMRRVTNWDWTGKKSNWQSRPLTLAADLEGSDAPFLDTSMHTQYLRAGRVRICSLPTNASRVSGRELQPEITKISTSPRNLHSPTHRVARFLCKPGKWLGKWLGLNADVPFVC